MEWFIVKLLEMCIRDSHNDDLETGWQKIERQITAEEELLGEWSEQVAAEEAQSALQEHVQASRENQKPVSYTHLDIQTILPRRF